MGFSILAKTLVDMGLRGALFDVQTLSYRMLTLRTYRDRTLPVGSVPAVFDPNNRFYNALKTSFDRWNADAVDNQLSNDDDLSKAAKSVVHMRAKRRIKKSRKQSARIMREVKKMRKQGYYGKNREIWDAVQLIHKAFRESFLTVRLTLRPEVYACIPQKLNITIHGEEYLVSALYKFDDTVNKYRLRRDIISTAESLRELQLTIAPYIFEKIHMR